MMEFLHNVTGIVQNSVSMVEQQYIVLGCAMGVVLFMVVRRRKPSQSVIRVDTHSGWWEMRNSIHKKRHR
jgi:hypothetical protein